MIALAVVAVPLLLYIPGWIFSRVFPGLMTDDLLELFYERIIISMLLSGWIAFVLAEIGFFSLGIHLAGLLVICGMLALCSHVLLRSDAACSPNPSLKGRVWQCQTPTEENIPPSPLERKEQRIEDIPNVAEIAAFVAIGLLSLLLNAQPFQVILGVRDAGVYANTGFAIARTGSIVQYDPLVAELGQRSLSDNAAWRDPAQQALSNFFGVQHPERFIATRMRAAGFFIHEGDAPQGRVVPQGFHLLPVWIALFTSMLGLAGGLFAPGLMGIMGVLSVGLLGRRLAGSLVGILASLFLALNSVQVWFARYSTTETTTQFLTFAGLFCFAKFQHCSNENNHQKAIFYATISGLSFGQLALTRIDFILVAAPLIGYLFLCWLFHRWNNGYTALSVAFGLLLVHAALHIIFIARAYFFDTAYARLQDFALTASIAMNFITPTLRDVYQTRTGSPLKDPLRIWHEIGIVFVALAGLIALWYWNKPLQWILTNLQRWQTIIVRSVAIAIVLLSLYAYIVRPQVINAKVLTAIPSCFLPQQWYQPTGACLTLQGYVGAPVALPNSAPAPSPVQAKQQNMYRYYETGLIALLSHMEREQKPTDLVVALKAQLLEQVSQAQQNGDNTERQQARAQLIAQLDPITYATVNRSFEELCQLNIPAPKYDAKYIIPLANLVRVGWYLSPLGVALGILGFSLWWWKGTTRASWLFLVVGLTGTFFYIRQTYGTSDQTYIYILRRFAPIAYPTFSLAMAYAIISVTEQQPLMPNASETHSFSVLIPKHLRFALRWMLIIMMIAFFAWTGRPIYRHVEYEGAIAQINELAGHFQSNDIVLLRGGGPTYGHFRDVMDLVSTPLHFIYGLNTLTVKSQEPSTYADLLAAQVRHWQQAGHSILLILSASGGDFSLPGFTLQPVSHFTLHVPEFEQLTNQKPRNVSSLTLPMAIYRLGEDSPSQHKTLPVVITATDFAAQMEGFYLAEQMSNQPAQVRNHSFPVLDSYAWTNGHALLRIPWHTQPLSNYLSITLAGGERPATLGLAHVCLSLQSEEISSPSATTQAISLGCFDLTNQMATYHIALSPAVEYSTENVSVQIESDTWIPAKEDPRQVDQRAVGVQFGMLRVP